MGVTRSGVAVCVPRIPPPNPATQPAAGGGRRGGVVRIAPLATKYWQPGGLKLTVGFLDGPPMDLRRRILLHMNAWSKTANIQFVATRANPQVRIARTLNDGHWSYVGTDVLRVPPDQPTMNLDGFTMRTSEKEFRRVVRHEAGHTLGFPHEHMRRALVARVDPHKAFAYYARIANWDEDMVRSQVLTPVEDQSLIFSTVPDSTSIMCYQIPGEITTDGKPILGGLDIDKTDYKFVSFLYPKKKGRRPRLMGP